MRLRFLLAVLVLAAPGCVGNFDPALYQQGVQPIALGDFCSEGQRASVPTLHRASPDDPSTSVTVSYSFDTRGLTSDVNDEVTVCASRAQPGNDGFLRVHMNDGERWHFHIRRPDNGMSPSIYVLGESCDMRACPAAAGLDLCGAGADEHFTYVASETADYYVGIDAADLGLDGEGGFSGQLDVIHPVCGNGTKEHSEGCDHGPDVEGDDCDANCRLLFDTGEEEIEPNDDTYGANHLVFTGTTTNVTGNLATACESDIFAFEVPDGAPADVTLELALADGGCPGEAAVPLALDLLLNETSSSPTAHVDADGVTCPMVTATAVAPGTHFVRLRSVEPGVSRNVHYRLTLTLD